jgi:hypothetical protein
MEKPIQTGGTLLEVTGATVTSARVVTVDVALLQASAPLLALRADGLGPGASLTTSGPCPGPHVEGEARQHGHALLARQEPAHHQRRRPRRGGEGELSPDHGGPHQPRQREHARHQQRRAPLRERRLHGGHTRRAHRLQRGTRQYRHRLQLSRLREHRRDSRRAHRRGPARKRAHHGRGHQNAGLGTITPNKALIRVDGAATRVTIGGTSLRFASSQPRARRPAALPRRPRDRRSSWRRRWPGAPPGPR